MEYMIWFNFISIETMMNINYVAKSHMETE